MYPWTYQDSLFWLELNLCSASMQEEAVEGWEMHWGIVRTFNALSFSPWLGRDWPYFLKVFQTILESIILIYFLICGWGRHTRTPLYHARMHAPLGLQHGSSNFVSQRKLCTSQSHNLSWNSMHSVQTNSIHVLHMEDAINQDGINALSEALEVNTTTVESLAFSSVQRTPLLIIPIWCCHHASVLLDSY